MNSETSDSGEKIPELSIVVPVYNEQECIGEFNTRINSVLDKLDVSVEIIYVNDGSADSSIDLIKEFATTNARVKFISFSRNFGHEIASTAGIDHSIGKAVVLIDSDLQDPPETIEVLYHKWKEGFDVVYAKRLNRDGESWLKKATSKYFYRILKKLSDVTIPLDAGDFRLMDRKVVDSLKLCRENPRYLRGLVSWVGYKQASIDYNREKRFAGNTKYNYLKLTALAVDAVISFSLVPLRIAILIGLFVIMLASALIVQQVLQKIFYAAEQGYAFLATSILFMAGVQLFFLGILSLYIGNIYINTKARPLYIISDSNVTRTL